MHEIAELIESQDEIENTINCPNENRWSPCV